MSRSLRLTACIVCLIAAFPVAGATAQVDVKTAPGAAAAAVTVRASGTIESIDAETRAVTIRGDAGRVVTLTAGPDVRNFEQLAVGQRVDAEYVQALTLELHPGSEAPISRTVEARSAGAREGQIPAGMLGNRVTIVAKVVGLDPERQVVTLEGPQQTVDLAIQDPEQFARVKLDDRVRAVYIEAAALKVRAAE